jgi:catechol 2,3-dioxygenase-like lactoylglutathione lyase family enzyme
MVRRLAGIVSRPAIGSTLEADGAGHRPASPWGRRTVLLRCDHVHLITHDIAGTVAWYGRVLGATPTFEGTYRGSRVVYLDIAGMTFIVFGRLAGEPEPAPGVPSPRYGVDHFGFAVEDLEAALATVRAAGARVIEGPVEVRPGLRIAYIAAPDEVRIELSERKP